MNVNPLDAGAAAVPVVDADKAGFGALTSESFLKLLITQLQNQDPSEPLGNEELLNQLATMRNLQANIELSDALKAITTNQQLSTAAGFIGKQVQGFGPDEEIRGIVDRAFLRDGVAYVGIGSEELPFSRIVSVEQPAG